MHYAVRIFKCYFGNRKFKEKNISRIILIYRIEILISVRKSNKIKLSIYKQQQQNSKLRAKHKTQCKIIHEQTLKHLTMLIKLNAILNTLLYTLLKL